MTASVPDAQPAQPGPTWRERSRPPHHAAVWVRIRGIWRPGTITAWVAIPGTPGPWTCQIAAEDGDSLPWSGRYIYDPRTIRPRNEPLSSEFPQLKSGRLDARASSGGYLTAHCRI